MRATVELYENSNEELPPIKTKVTLGKEDLSIKVRTSTHTPSYRLVYLWGDHMQVNLTCYYLMLLY